jgi:hypothetical protein
VCTDKVETIVREFLEIYVNEDDETTLLIKTNGETIIDVSFLINHLGHGVHKKICKIFSGRDRNNTSTKYGSSLFLMGNLHLALKC